MKRILAVAAVTAVTFAPAAGAAAKPSSGKGPGSPVGIELTELGRYVAPGAEFDEGGAEIVSHDASTQRLFVANGSEKTVDVLDIADAATPKIVQQVDLSAYGAGITSVASKNGLAAVTVHPEDPQANPGAVIFLDAVTLEVVAEVTAGYLPDSVAFAPDASVVMVANEGEPSDDYTVDPEGSLTIVDLATFEATQVDFRDITTTDLDDSVRIFGPGATIAQDLEPEYITFSSDSGTAWVSLQENNAIAEIDVTSGKVAAVFGLGFKDWTEAGNGFDASNRDEAINIRDWPVLGIPQPDALASYQVGRETFLVTANEGDARDYDGYSEEARVKNVTLCDDVAYDGMGAEVLAEDENLGRLHLTTANGYDDERACFEQIYAYGGRSFSIYTADGELVYDSGSDFEDITAAELGHNGFNANNDESGTEAFDSRSDDKGPEPEGVVVGKAYGHTYAFIGLERVGGVMTYRVSDPHNTEFISYTTGRDFAADEAAGSVDLGPEGVLFISDADSPTGRPLLVLSHEVTGTTTVYQLDPVPPAPK
jgi:hypothetical protein